ncbi:MAG: hypothetical protein HYZ28_10525 [Myxococcales bacterium]|nr:hypothetical protein [Myxococcales bacterium]
MHAILLAVASLALNSGFGPYKFGMSPEQVKAIRDCGPYIDVPKDGSVECRDYPLSRGTTAKWATFYFDEQKRMKKVQLVFAEGAKRDQGLEALNTTLSYLARFGALESTDVKEVEAAAIFAALDAQSGQARVQFKPKKNLPVAFVFGTAYHHPGSGYFVFVYFTPPR